MKETIITGALLHDIGKLLYHGLQEKEFRKGYRHQELGGKWASGTWLSEDVVTIIKRHHHLNKDDSKYVELSVDSFQGNRALYNTLLLVANADNLAAGMEREDFSAQEGSFNNAAGLKTIFSEISLGESEQQNKSPSFIWEPKQITDYPYPLPENTYKKSTYEAFYTKQREGFCADFQLLKDNLNEDSLLVLLQKYTMMIPEHTFVVDTEFPDTSLYHHLKSSAAIAWCTYKYLTEELQLAWQKDDASGEIQQDSMEKYLLIAGDFSGIQNFIYTISSKAALKTVRARSFYLELLAETAVSRLIEELDLCRSCIVYNSGGGFYLLAPNTKFVKEKLACLTRQFNDELWQRHGFVLYLNTVTAPLSGEALKGTGENKTTALSEVWSNLKKDLGQEKGRKWLKFLEENFEEEFKPKVEEESCKICHQPLKKQDEKMGHAFREKVITTEATTPKTAVEEENADFDDLKLCNFCRDMLVLGKLLPNITTFYRVKSPNQGGYLLEVFNTMYCFKSEQVSKLEPASKSEPAKELIACKYLVKNLWSLSPVTPVRNFPTGSYACLKEFIKLGESAVGLKKLGILRMDVDFLGKIFGRGLQKKNTFARLNDLSERLNLYFKHYLPERLKTGGDAYLTNIKRDKLLVNLIYSGGDDLFLVGTWDSALDAAALIYRDFRKFTADNPQITLSGGLTIADEKDAFYRLAAEAGVEEKKAKNNGRDSMSLLGIPLKWQEIITLKADEQEDLNLQYLLQILMRGIENRGGSYVPVAYSRSFLQKLIEAYNRYFQDIKESSKRQYWIFPQLHYTMARVMESSQGKKHNHTFYRPLFSIMLQEKVLTGRMLIALQIVEYLTRTNI